MSAHIRMRFAKSDIFLAISSVFALFSLILYLATGKTIFTLTLSPTVIIGISASLALCIVLAVFRFFVSVGKTGRGLLEIAFYFIYFSGLFTFVSFITSEVNYIASIFVGIDGTVFTWSFILTLVTVFITWLSALLGAIVFKNEITLDKKTQER